MSSNPTPKEKKKIIRELKRKLRQQPPTALPEFYLLDNKQKYEWDNCIVPNEKNFQICYFKNKDGERISYKSTDLNINYHTGECTIKSEEEILKNQINELKKEQGELEDKIRNIAINKDNYFDWRTKQRNLMKD